MKLKKILAVCCCVALAAFSALTAYAEPDDSNYLDDIYDWASSTVSDAVDDYLNNSDSSDTSSDDTSHEDSSDYYEDTEPETEPETYYEQTEPYYEETEPQQESSNWYDWFTVSQDETEPETETIPEPDSSQAGTTEYVGYGFFMWVVIVVGAIITLAIITNTHLRKKS